ncbi:MAG TPA: hypothetical protein VGN32_09005, partial [Ktedonobacterales bacterium]|nr:hypothetical protein [Ktedonobacterales bacterium]
MTESTHDFDARLRAFLASAAARPTPPGLEDRLVAYVGRRRFAFLPRSVAAVAAVSVDDAFAAPSRRAARLGAATAALATVAVAVVGLASHTTITAPGGAGTFPAQQMTATASPVDLGAARAAAAGFFDPALPQCWTDPAVKGMAPPVDSYARCPVT